MTCGSLPCLEAFFVFRSLSPIKAGEFVAAFALKNLTRFENRNLLQDRRRTHGGGGAIYPAAECTFEGRESARAGRLHSLASMPPTFDQLDQGARSRLMAKIRKTDTKPELRVRKVAHSLGYRFRLHRRDLPGTPDLVFPRLRKVIFVHGCFWHQHGCRLTKKPRSNLSYWLPKLERIKARDAEAASNLSALGWDVHVLWECETTDLKSLEERISRILGQVCRTR